MLRRFFNRGRVPSGDPQGLRRRPTPRGRGGAQLHPGNQEGITITQPAATATWEKTGGGTCEPARPARIGNREEPNFQAAGRQATSPASTQEPRPDSSCLPPDGFTHS